jgi:hypothetical protein
MIDYQDHALLLNQSYRHWLGEYLVEQQDPGEVLSALNTADFAVVSHGLEADPIFNYGNLQALSCFGYEHLKFLQLPSRSTMPDEAVNQSQQPLLSQLEEQGFATIAQDTRVTSGGRKFVVDRGVVWKLIDNLGRIHGHATRRDEWHFADEAV